MMSALCITSLKASGIKSHGFNQESSPQRCHAADVTFGYPVRLRETAVHCPHAGQSCIAADDHPWTTLSDDGTQESASFLALRTPFRGSMTELRGRNIILSRNVPCTQPIEGLHLSFIAHCPKSHIVVPNLPIRSPGLSRSEIISWAVTVPGEGDTMLRNGSCRLRHNYPSSR